MEWLAESRAISQYWLSQGLTVTESSTDCDWVKDWLKNSQWESLTDDDNNRDGMRLYDSLGIIHFIINLQPWSLSSIADLCYHVYSIYGSHKLIDQHVISTSIQSEINLLRAGDKWGLRTSNLISYHHSNLKKKSFFFLIFLSIISFFSKCSNHSRGRNPVHSSHLSSKDKAPPLITTAIFAFW